MNNRVLTAEEVSEAAYASITVQTVMLGMLMECRVEDGLTTMEEAAATLRRYAGYCGVAAAAMPFLRVADYLESGSGPKLTMISGGLAED